MKDIQVRNAEPTDYRPVISVINEWWGGRTMADMLPKLFFVHFRETSFVAETGGSIIGFLTGFLSQTHTKEAYIHFVGVHPDFRGKGVGRSLYNRFSNTVLDMGKEVIRCVTSPVNKTSIAFHLRMGFAISPGEMDGEGAPFTKDYDGPGGDRVLFVKNLIDEQITFFQTEGAHI